MRAHLEAQRLQMIRIEIDLDGAIHPRGQVQVVGIRNCVEYEAVMVMVVMSVWHHRDGSDRQRGHEERLADRNFKGLHLLPVWAGA
ncbi:MAG TPA: hypothetical protein VFQ65_10710 [Kofleriaceae bacterium]|nr:hypothetical protein [Kofleriaceae bacterium]